jgi:anti-anti-sigma regulatory factor
MSSEAIVFALSGDLDNEHLESLNELLEGEKRSILLDLGDVTLVGRKAVEFLARLEAAGVGLINCPEYVRTWIDAEKNGQTLVTP